MVQRVTVSPSEVRGYGDIVSPKTTEDFTEYMCSVTESDGVYTMAYDDTGSYLRLSANPTSLQYLAPCYLYATLKVDGALAVGETVSFYEGETLLGTGETDSSGIATLSKSTFTVGTHTVKAVYAELESNAVSVTVVKATTSVSLSSDKSIVFPEESFTLSGTVSRSGLLLSDVDVKIYNGNVLVDTVQTGSQGAFSKTITDASAGTNTYHAVFEGNSDFEGSTSSDVDVSVIGGSYIGLGVTGNSFSSYNTTPFTYTGNVFVDWGDNTGFVEYTGGQLSHTYASSGNYTVKVYGDITSLGQDCFRGCTGLTSIVISDSVTSLGSNCFYNCTGLTSVTIPDSVVSIGGYCFYYCTGLTSIVIPDSVTSLGNGCFWWCAGLTSVTIPDTVTSLGSYCFESCTGLTELVLEWDSSSEILTYNNNWIEDCSSFSHFLIPEGTKSLYTAKNYPSNLLKEDGEPTPATITLTGTKSILSYADSESSVLTATVLDDNDDPVEGVSVDLYKDSVLWDTLTTGSAGTVSKTYTSLGAGDVSFHAECGSLVTENLTIEDCVDVITGETDQSSKFGSSIGLRNSGTGNITYDSTNQYYVTNLTKNGSEAFVPINSANGLDDVLIEFDGFLPTPSSSLTSFLALGVYHDSNNWARLGEKATLNNGSPFEYGINNNGTYTESDISGATTQSNVWLHLKFKITNNSIQRQAYNGTTLVFEEIRTYSSSWFDNTTKYGFNLLWGTAWKGYFKNLKIKPL